MEANNIRKLATEAMPACIPIRLLPVFHIATLKVQGRRLARLVENMLVSPVLKSKYDPRTFLTGAAYGYVQEKTKYILRNIVADLHLNKLDLSFWLFEHGMTVCRLSGGRDRAPQETVVEALLAASLVVKHIHLSPNHSHLMVNVSQNAPGKLGAERDVSLRPCGFYRREDCTCMAQGAVNATLWAKEIGSSLQKM